MAAESVEGDRTRVVINISGSRFETSYGVLERFPGTRLSLLATLRQDDEAYDVDRGEYYFERHPEVFADILHFYRTDELHIRHNLCGNVVKREFEFWGMYEQDIEPCCWTSYSQAAECKETLAGIDNTFLTGKAAQKESWEAETNGWIKFRRKVWAILEDPSTSMASRVYVFTSMLLVVISIVCFVAETYEGFRVPIGNASKVPAANCAMPCGSYVDPQHVPGTLNYNYDETEPHPVLINIDYALYALFVIEFIVRVFFAPSFRAYFTDFLNWIDIICVLTHTVSVVMNSLESLDYSSPLVKTAMNLRLLRGLRIVRILRIFKLVKHYNAFKILVYTIKISLRELMLMIVFLFVGAVIFGSIIHLVERESFKNIPLGLWWALVTMTTVGYGDFVPRQAAGYAIGCICVIFGVLTIAFTVPIVVNNFAMYYSHAQSRNKKPKEYWRIKRVPQKDLKKPTGIMAALSKFKKAPGDAPVPDSSDLYGGGGGDGAAGKTVSVNSVAMSVMWNNLNLSDAKKSAYQTDKVTLMTPRGGGDQSGGGGGGQTTEDSSTLTAFAAPTGPRFFARRAPMTPVQEVLDLDMDEARVNEEHEERSRQLLAQAQENDQQVSAAKERQADALEKRKAALKSRLASAKQPQGGANSSASSDGKKPASAKKPFPANPARPGSKK
ncbi:hypothetical protein BOX15_Mlig002764g1 [Macrostomum lignano]|uniref:BTB domain-containing protein n=1 Tax=Macrostomum lignano TaxID=282301 RepID=A0A267GUI6_9PLAT|nr:hypothetical protein BOX15_Mlig002764g3 [Macrostomum lignano]PAA89685.1 hypothetical protein BOX15_Mlig002764g1 [Macrostomum lignano]